MTNHQLSILRIIAAHQPILKEDLYRLSSLTSKDSQNYQLKNLRKQGYIQFERKQGPVWLTVRGSEVVDEI